MNLALWRDTRTTWGIDYWAYLGLGLIVFGTAGVVGLARGRLPPQARGAALPACACLALCFFLYNPVVRDIVFLLFFLGVLAGLGLDWLLDQPIFAGRGLLLATLLAAADLASTSVRPVARTDKGFMVEAGRLLERTAPNQRVVQIGVAPDGGLDADIGPNGSPLSYYSTVQRIAGNHNMAATRMHNFLAVTAKQAQSDLQASGVLSPETERLLALFNVGRVICNTALANGCPASTRNYTDDAILGRFIAVPAMPAVFSRRLVALTMPPGLEKPMLWPEDFRSFESEPRRNAVAAMLRRFAAVEGVDPATRTARAIAVRDDTAATGAAEAAEPWHPVIQDYAVGLTAVTLRVQADAPGYVQLSHPWFPSSEVTVNGAAVQPVRGLIDLMVVPIRPGVSVIELHEGWTLVRLLSALTSLVGLIATLAAAAMLAQRDRAGLRSPRAGRPGTSAPLARRP